MRGRRSLIPVARLIFVTQLIDPEDPNLGFVVPQLNALADRVDGLTIVANEVRSVPSDLRAEVISLGKERGLGQIARGARYEAVIAREIRQHRPVALLAHMCPVYLNLAAPLARVSRTRTLLWFVHSSNTQSLALAERLADVVITAFPGSYPRSSPKVRPIGHAIDTSAFPWSPVTRAADAPLRLLAVGRTSGYKGYEVMIRAVAAVRAAGLDVELRIVGPSVNPSEVQYRAHLQEVISRERGGFRLEDGVPRGSMPALLREADVLINATEDFSADKVVFEAMAMGMPVLVSSPAFAPLVDRAALPLAFPRDDATLLAERVSGLASASNQQLDELGRALRLRIEQEHSLEHWTDEVAKLADGLVGRASVAGGRSAV